MKLKFKKIIFYLFLLNLMLTSFTYTQTLSIENIQFFDKYLPDEEILSYLMDEQNDIWLSGYGSLYHYNGFCNQKINHHFLSNEYFNTVHKIDSSYYIFSSNRSVYLIKNPLDSSFQVNLLYRVPVKSKDNIVKNYINGKNLIILTFQHLFSLDITHGTLDTLLQASESENFLFISTELNKYYITTNSDKMYQVEISPLKIKTYKLSGFTIYGTTPLHKHMGNSKKQLFIAQTVSNTKKLSNNLILFTLDTIKNTIHITKKINLSFNKFLNEELTFFHVLSPKMFFIWTYNQGCYLVDIDGNYLPVNNSTGLPTNEIYNSYYYPPYVVLLSPNGISYLKNPQIIQLTKSTGLPDNNIWNIVKIKNSFYIATSAGLARASKINPLRYDLKTINYFKNNSIFSLGKDYNENLWISLGDFNGLYMYDGKKFSHIIPNTIDDLSFTSHFIPLPDHHLLLAGANFVYIYDYNSFQKSAVTDSLQKNNETINNVQLLQDSLIFVTTNKTIWKYNFKKKKIRKFRSYKNIHNSYFLNTNEYIISKDDKKTYYINKKDSILLTYKFCSENVYNIDYSPEKNVIIISDNSGIHFIQKDLSRVKHINELNGLPVNETNFGALYFDEKQLWIGTTKGIAILPLDNIFALPDFQWKIDSHITFYGYKNTKTQNLLFDKEYVTTSSMNNFKINFSPIFPTSVPLFFSEIKELKSPSPIYKKGQFSLEVPNLPAGEYEFHLTFFWKNKLYTLKSGLIKVKVTPPFYTTPWFFIIILLVLIFFIIGLIQWKSSRLKRLNEKLRKMVQAQTEDLERYKSILEGVLQNIDEKFFVFSKDGDIILLNEAAKAMEIKDVKSLFSMFPEDIAINLNVIFENQLTESLSANQPIIIDNQSYSFSFNPLIVDNQLEGYSLLLINISRLLENEQLKTKLETLNQIFATFSHYLNNYLQTIVLQIDFYELHPDKFDVNHSLNEIKLSVDKIKMILAGIEDILNSQKYQTLEYAGIKNILIDLDIKNEKNK